ncbi:MAG: hypothetical protein ABJD13_12205 [Paracoccaceae bacterium]
MQDVGKARISQIIGFIDLLENAGVDTSLARRFAKSGQWALAFGQVYHAAVSDGDFYRSLEVELEQLNNFFAMDDYMAKHFGFPL